VRIAALAFLFPLCCPAQQITEAHPVSEEALRESVAHVEQMSKDLQAGLKTYHQQLLVSMFKLGYGQYHPVFSTRVNGFETRPFNLEDFAEFKMGRLAFDLRSQGTQLVPDPFLVWADVQRLIDDFNDTIDNARRVVVRTSIVDSNSSQNIPDEDFRKLMSRWRAAVKRANDQYEHALAVRAVLYEKGELVPAPPTIKWSSGGTNAATICGFGICPP
jgi:hypothetical protein